MKKARSNLLNELERMHKRYYELEGKISDPEVIGKPEYNEYLREFGQLKGTVELYEKFKECVEQIKEDKELLEEEDTEEELKEIAVEEIEQKEKESEAYFEQIKESLYREETRSDRVIIEIRAGTGGDEASLFAADLFKMYMHYCDKNRWKTEVLDSTSTSLKGYKNIIFAVKGKGAYNRLQYESGGHRVQRVPVTESSGRIHTSAATVAVLPEAEDIEVELKDSDLEIETFRSSGPGGQSVNTMDSAVRIRHKPTGVVASCQDGKSQHSNKDKAMRILKTRILEDLKQKQRRERGDMRRQQIGSGDRNERIRTYNFPQSRVTDHRIDFSLYDLEMFLSGEIDEILDKLEEYYKEKYFEEYAV